MKKVGFLLLCGVVASLGWAGVTVADLERMAARDLIPEIQLAAGYALVNTYATKSEADLLNLASSAPGAGTRLAASLALAQKWLDAGKTREEWLALATEGKTAEARAAATLALMEILLGDAADALLELAKTGDTEEVQYAAGKAYLQKIRGKLSRETLESICSDETLTPGYRKAAAEVLAGYYLFPKLTALSRQELEERALNEANPYLRYAAAYALVSFLVEEPADVLYRKVVSLFLAPRVSAEYRWAYARALGLAWAEGL
ncbi:MAG: hypothetical protein ACUVQS_00660 [Candidatus Bipolaricaulaceae bacterium]